jgi:hypothetical protein
VILCVGLQPKVSADDYTITVTPAFEANQPMNTYASGAVVTLTGKSFGTIKNNTASTRNIGLTLIGRVFMVKAGVEYLNREIPLTLPIYPLAADQTLRFPTTNFHVVSKADPVPDGTYTATSRASLTENKSGQDASSDTNKTVTVG